MGLNMTKNFKQFFLLAVLVGVQTACSFVNPFNTDVKELSRVPKNATGYDCDGGKQFYVRMLNNGSDAWLIYPDHEVNLTNAADNKSRYTSGNITLLLNGDQTTLNDGDKIAYTACKPQLKK